jgi:hypothetical protein
MADADLRVRRLGIALTDWERERIAFVAETKGLPDSLVFREYGLPLILAEADRLDEVFAKRVTT